VKHSEIYDKHDDRRKAARKPKKKGSDKSDRIDRLARVSFKKYVQNVRQAELEEELEAPLDDDQR